MKRIAWLDILKFLAIYLVVLGHLVSTNEQPHLKGIIYSFHMPLFFIIIGFLYKEQAGGMHHVKTLMVPYILLSALYFPIYIIFHRHENFWCDYVEQFLYGKALWFIPALFVMKMTFVPIVHQYNMYKAIVLMIMSFICAYIYYQYSHTFDFHIFRFFPFFIMGYIVKKEKIELLISGKICLASLVVYMISVLLCGGYAELIQFVRVDYVIHFFVQGLGGIIVSTYIAQNTLRLTRIKFVNVIAKGTIFVYAFHFAFLPLVFRIIQKIDISTLAWYYPILQCSIALIIIIFLYGPILFVMKYCPVILGKYK